MRADLVALLERAVEPAPVSVVGDQAVIGTGPGRATVYACDRWSAIASVAGRTRADLVAGAEVGADLLDRLAAAGVVDDAPLPEPPPTCGHAIVVGRTPIACELGPDHDGDHAGSGVRWSP